MNKLGVFLALGLSSVAFANDDGGGDIGSSGGLQGATCTLTSKISSFQKTFVFHAKKPEARRFGPLIGIDDSDCVSIDEVGKIAQQRYLSHFAAEIKTKQKACRKIPLYKQKENRTCQDELAWMVDSYDYRSKNYPTQATYQLCFSPTISDRKTRSCGPGCSDLISETVGPGMYVREHVESGTGFSDTNASMFRLDLGYEGRNANVVLYPTEPRLDNASMTGDSPANVPDQAADFVLNCRQGPAAATSPITNSPEPAQESAQ